jgi:amino acid permease
MQIAPKKELSLFDSTCIIVGIIIGAGIYKLAPNIATGAGSWVMQNWRRLIPKREETMFI